jgi:energy-coupling factor transporter ATP-binding protein EcfA2
MVEKVRVRGFRGLNLELNLKRVNIIIGENGSGKTSLLEAIFLATLFQSDLNYFSSNFHFYYAMVSRGDPLSAFSTLGDSEVITDGTSVAFEKSDHRTLLVYVNGEKVAEVIVTDLLTRNPIPIVKLLKPVQGGLSPFLITPYFDYNGVPETVFSLAELKSKATNGFGIIRNEFGQFTLFYKDTPAFMIGRGVLKTELIKLILSFSNPVLIDGLESSLHPDNLREVLSAIKRSDAQVLFTTYSDDVLKLAGKLFGDDEAQVIYLWKGGHKEYKLSELSEFEKPLSWVGYI